MKVFVINNRCMGMVRQWQQMIHGERYSQSRFETLPDFVRLAEAYGALGLRGEKPEDLDPVITRMLDARGQVVADCRVRQLANCYPMIPPGAAHDEMVLA